MKTLAEHDAEKIESHHKWQRSNQAHANGITCPECGKELWDSPTLVLLTSYPPRIAVRCPACGYSGTRLV